MAEEENGFSLIELLVVISIFTMVLGAVLGLLDMTARTAPRDQERALAIREAQVGLDRMTRELRSAYRVLSPSGPGSTGVMDVFARVNGVARRVRYRCDVSAGSTTYPGDQRCVRSEGPADPAVNPTGEAVVIDRVLNGSAVFSAVFAAGDPSYVTAVVKVPARGERKEGFAHRVVLDDGMFLRNLELNR